MNDDGTDETDDPAYVATWKANTTAFDRVRSVANTLESPRPAAWIAEEAHVSEPTARDHLSRLVDLGVLMTDQSDAGKTYYPDPVYTRLSAIQDLVRNNTEQKLATQAVEVQGTITEWKAQYDVSTPGELRRTAMEDIDLEEAQKRLRTATDWESATYQLSLLRDAIDHYDTYLSTARESPRSRR